MTVLIAQAKALVAGATRTQLDTAAVIVFVLIVLVATL